MKFGPRCTRKDDDSEMTATDVIIGSVVVTALALAFYVLVRVVFASGEVNSCYIVDTSPGSGSEFKRYSLMANVDWRPDYPISGNYTSLHDAVAGASEIGCNLK